MEQPRVMEGPGAWRPLLRSVLVGASILTGVLWLGVLGIAVLTYALMTRAFSVAVTWDLGRWDAWTFAAHTERSAAAMTVAGAWWILLPLLALLAAALAAGLRSRPTKSS